MLVEVNNSKQNISVGPPSCNSDELGI